MTKKCIAIILVLVLVLSMFAACSSSQDKSQSVDSSTEAKSDSASSAEKTEEKKDDTKKEETKKEEPKKEEAPETDDRLAYLNLESTWPVVKDGYEVPLEIYTTQLGYNAGDYDINWYLHYLEDKSNIQINWTQIQSEAVSEQKSLILASEDIPDIMISFGFSALELSEYGEAQELLLNIAPYITSELTPTIVQRFEETPAGKAAITLPSGNIYTLPRLASSRYGAYSSHDFYNMTYLDAMGYEIPKTIDEVVEVLYAFLEQDPANQGAANLPIAASSSYWMDVTTYLLAGYGFVGGGNGARLDLRNDEVVYTAYEDVFVEYLKLMNKFFADGIISKDFYTMDSTALAALAAEGNCLLVAGPPFCLVTDRWDEYNAHIPLTSEFNDTPIAGYGFPHSIGQFVVSAKTEYPEVCMRFADYFFTDEYPAITRNGPCAAYPFESYGILEEGVDVGWHIDEENNIMVGNMTLAEYNDTWEKKRGNQLYMISSNEPFGIYSEYYADDGYNTVSLMKNYAGMGWQKMEYNLADPDNNYIYKVDKIWHLTA